MAEISIDGVRKTFGKTVATRDVSLRIEDREFMVLLGPSGCGKTTLLRCIAGLEQVDTGRIVIGGQEVTDLPPRQRRIAMVFQSYAVFPHLSIYENIAFGLRMRHAPDSEIKQRVREAADLLHIGDLLERHPAQISGGQRQRVAVARAIAVQAEVLLMDEPLSNLDALLRMEMRAELKRLLKDLHSTVVYVTHDQVEALSLGDRIAVMKDGAILQCGTPLSVYDFPASQFIGGFIGNPPMNFLPGQLRSSGTQLEVRVGEAILRPGPEAEHQLRSVAGERVIVGVRAENVDVSSAPMEFTLPAKVLVIEPLGSHNLLTAEVGEVRVKVNTRADAPFTLGQTVWLRMAPEKIRWLDPATGLAIT